MPGAFGTTLAPTIALSIFTTGKISSNISLVIAPGRKMIGTSSVQSTIVDSTPNWQAPPSKTISILLCKSL